MTGQIVSAPPGALSHSSMAASPWRRAWCAVGAVIWIVAFAWIWLGAPPLGRLLGAGWFALWVVCPPAGWISLALALPWFGNNPGGPHHLYLLDMGLMGLVVRHLAGRALGRWSAHPDRVLDPWITLLVACSWISLAPQLRWIRCDYLLGPAGFLYQIYNHYATAPVFGLRAAMDLTLAAGLYVTLRDLPWSDSLRRWFWRALVAALALSAAIGLLHYVGQMPLEWWRGENPDIHHFGYRRLQSLFWHSGWYAQYLAPVATVAVALGWAAREPKRRWGWWGLALVLVPVQLLTFQRGGWIALAVGTAAVVAGATWTRSGAVGEPSPSRHLRTLLIRMGMVLAAVFIMALVLALGIESFRHRLGELFVFHHRTDIWRSAVGMIEGYPLGGVGLGNYYLTHTRLYLPPHPFFHLDKVTAHNLFLHVWAERGLIGLVPLLAIIYLSFYRVWRGLRIEGDRDGRGESLALLGPLSALVAYGLFQYIFYLRLIEIMFWLLVARTTWLGRGCIRSAAISSIPPPGATLRPTHLAMAAFVVVAAIVVLWENRNNLKPWKVHLNGDNLRVAGEMVSLELPAEARRVGLVLGSLDPSASESPIVYTLTLNDQVMQRIELNNARSLKIELNLPPDRPPGAPLVIRASRTWEPYALSGRQIPVMEIGILYSAPRQLEAEEDGDLPAVLISPRPSARP